MPDGTEYKIVVAQSLAKLEKKTQDLVNEKWQPAGPITVTSEGYCHEMIRMPALPMEQSQGLVEAAQEQAAKEFQAKWEKMDSAVRDLLVINDINIFVQNGQLFTSAQGKIMAGISPNEILALLKNSKHCPLDLDEEKVLNAIEGLL